jgi:hypothetical protein
MLDYLPGMYKQGCEFHPQHPQNKQSIKLKWKFKKPGT